MKVNDVINNIAKDETIINVNNNNIIIEESGTYHFIYNYKNPLCNINITIKDNIKVDIIEYHFFEGKDLSYFYNQNIEVLENSEVTYNFLYINNNISLDKKINIKLFKNSYIKTYILELSNNNQSTYSIDLIDQYATAEFNLMIYLDKIKDQKHEININHLNENTTSNMYNHAVINDFANCVIDAKTYIKENANKSKANQINKVLMLSNTCQNSINPKLLIDCFNVQGGHTATSGRVSDEDMYYLQSRGIDQNAANRLFTIGYLMKNTPHYLTEIIIKEIERRISYE